MHQIPTIALEKQGLHPAAPVQASFWRFPRDDYPIHRHDFSELVIVCRGSGQHQTEWGLVPIAAGDVFAIAPGQVHGFAHSRDMEIINCMFLPTWLQAHTYDLTALSGYHALFILEPVYREQERNYNRLRLSAQQLKMIKPLCVDLTEPIRHTQAPQARKVAAMQRLIVELCSIFSEENSEANPLMALAESVALLESEYSRDISLAELADAAHLSVNQFIRRFKSDYGVTPIMYLNRLRLNHAKALLTTTNDSITKIAFASGFNDSNYFSRIFKKEVGQTPKSYRQQLQVSSL